MPILSDGTPIQIQEKTFQDLCDTVQKAFDDNEQEILVEIKGYQSKSSGRVIDITLNIIFDYRQLLLETLEHVEEYSLQHIDTSLASTKDWRTAKQELEASLRNSLRRRNFHDHSSHSAENLLEDVPSFRAGYTSGLIQLQGIVEEYTIIEEGDKKPVNSKPKTLAKEEILEGTFRDSDTIGAFKTIALEKGRFESITIGTTTFSDEGFYTDTEDEAFRVFTGEHGHSKRIVLSEAKNETLIDLQGTFCDYELIKKYQHSGSTLPLSTIQRREKIPLHALTLAEITAQKSLRSDTLIAIETDEHFDIQEIRATAHKPTTIGPSPSSVTFVEVKSTSKKVHDGNTILFLRPKSRQITAHLHWNQNQDLDLNCFIELKNGQKYNLQPLSKTFGALEHAPYALHSGDDRLGKTKGGEFIFVGMNQLHHIQRMVFYATIYSGASNWAQTNATVTITIPDHPTIEIPLHEQDVPSNHDVCALCSIVIQNKHIHVESHTTFHTDELIQHHGRTTTPIDVAYNFGLTWDAEDKG